MVKTILKLAACAAFFASCSPAMAQECMDREKAAKGFWAEGAQVASIGQVSGGYFIIWRRSNGDWVMVFDNGVTMCFRANGRAWENFPSGEEL